MGDNLEWLTQGEKGLQAELFRMGHEIAWLRPYVKELGTRVAVLEEALQAAGIEIDQAPGQYKRDNEATT